MYIAYDRIACFGTEDRNFRVTLDTNIRWRTENLCLGGPTEGTRLVSHGGENTRCCAPMVQQNSG